MIAVITVIGHIIHFHNCFLEHEREGDTFWSDLEANDLLNYQILIFNFLNMY